MSMKLSTLWDWRVAGHSEVIRVAQEVMQQYRDTGKVSAELISAQKEHRLSLLAGRRALYDVRLQHRLYNVELNETMRIMRSVASIGRMGVYMWQAYNIAVMRLSESKERYADSSEKVADLEERLIQYTKEFGEESVYTQDIADKLNIAREREADALKDVQRAQKQNVIGYITMGLAATNLIPTLVSVAQRLRYIGDVSGAVGGAAAAAEAAVAAKTGGIAAGISAAITPVAAAAFVAAPFVAYALMTPEERREKRMEAYQQQSMAAQVIQSFGGMGPPQFTINNYGDIVRIEDFEEMGEAVYDGFMRKVGEALR